MFLSMQFAFERPKSHLKKSGGLRAGAPGIAAAGNADALKLGRATEDALRGILFLDDRQTRVLFIASTYAAKTGCLVTAIEIGEDMDFGILGAKVHELVQAEVEFPSAKDGENGSPSTTD